MSFFLCLVNGGWAVFVRLDLSHGGSVELQSVGIVDDAVEDGVGEGGFADACIKQTRFAMILSVVAFDRQ